MSYFSTLYLFSVCYVNYTKVSGHIESPNYPLEYPNRYKCRHRIKYEKPSYRLTLKFVSFDIQKASGCSQDSLKIYDGESESSSLINQAYCGSALPPEIVSTNNALFLVFESNDEGKNNGFQLTYFSCKYPLLLFHSFVIKKGSTSPVYKKLVLG